MIFPAGRKWSPAFSQFVNSREMIHGIVEPEHGTTLMVTTLSAQSANIETYQGEKNKNLVATLRCLWFTRVSS